MKVIFLTQNKASLIDDEDYELISQFSWHAARCNRTKDLWRVCLYQLSEGGI